MMQLPQVAEFLHPFRLVRKYVRVPVETFLVRTLQGYRKKTQDGLYNIKDLVLRTSILALFISAIIWISVFMYIVFYYTYMPNITHMRPVHLQFKSCDELPGICSFPSAHVQLTKRNQMLMVGQPYRIKLILDMPESRANKDLGMFMVCAQLRARGGALVSSSCRSAMLRHRSLLHHIMRTFVLAPMLIAGLGEEKQQLQVELFSDFEDDQKLPVTDAYVELQSRHAQLYGASLHIEAHFTGLRHLMFHWPILSAVLGISTNLFFVAMIFILSWYRLQEGLPDLIRATVLKKEERETTEEYSEDKMAVKGIKLEREDSQDLEEASFLDDSPTEEDVPKSSIVI